ncbi:MAG: B12-binding domain-containing radical SAM protein [Pseudodesulfovibrio sp.]
MKRLNVLFVNPKQWADAKVNPEKALYPYSIVYLVNFLKKNDICDADYIDLTMDSDETYYERIKNEHFDLIGITALTTGRLHAMKVVRETAKRSPNSKIVVGGPFFGNKPVETLEHLPEIDFVGVGEGEHTTAELVKHLQSGTPALNEIDGLLFRENGKIIRNKPRKYEKNLDLFDIEEELIYKPNYKYLHPLKGWEDDPDKSNSYIIMAGRGCINACIYCLNSRKPFRHHSVDYLIDKIKDIKKRHNSRNIFFGDPSFASSPSYLKEFCNRVIDEKIDIQWYCEGRPDIDLDTLELMAKAGCISYDFAMETGSNKIMKTLRRRTDLDMIINFATKLNELGMRGDFFTMMSLPDERTKDLFQTLMYIFKLNKLGFKTTLVPFFIVPGTKLEEMSIERGMLPSDFSWFDESYECTEKHIHEAKKHIPHYIEFFDSYDLQKLSGFHLAMQDFITKEPRVRKLRYSFMGTIAHVIGFFLKGAEKWDFKYVFDVLKLSVKMYSWFWIWKMKKPYYDYLEKKECQTQQEAELSSDHE